MIHVLTLYGHPHRTVSWTATEDGQVVQTGTDTVSRDGKTFTITVAGFDVNGQPTNNILVFDKQ
jgi:hypothetical protein